MSDALGDFAATIALDPVVDEPPREGEPGDDPCHYCQVSVSEALWANPNWRALARHWSPLPGGVLLVSTDHVDTLAELPRARQAEFGVIVAAIETAIMSLGAASRVHIYRWGDGRAHFHVHFIGRPAGRPQFAWRNLPLLRRLAPSPRRRRTYPRRHRRRAPPRRSEPANLILPMSREAP